MNSKYPKSTLVEILKKYGLSAKHVTIIKEPKADKVWVVHDKKNNRWLVLKRLERYKTLFPILLNHRLSETGFAAPRVYQTLKGQVYVNHLDRLFYVSEFIRDLDRIDDQQRIAALAQFHNRARFAELNRFKEVSRYPTTNTFLQSYMNKVNEIQKWMSSTSSSALQAAMLDMTRIGKQVHNLLKAIDVEEYIQQMSIRHTICHGDYNMNNAFTTASGDFLIIDFDLAYYGLPVEDFRFLLMSMQRNNPDNALPPLDLLFNTYFHVCPEYAKYKNIYTVDAMFPHEFYKQIQRIIDQEGVKNLQRHETKLVKLAEIEREKFELLS